MDDPNNLVFEHDPKPDERSAEELAVANAVRKAFGRPVQSILVGDGGTGAQRLTTIALAFGFWHAGHFNRRHPYMVEAAKQVVGSEGTVRVERIPSAVARDMKKM